MRQPDVPPGGASSAPHSKAEPWNEILWSLGTRFCGGLDRAIFQSLGLMGPPKTFLLINDGAVQL